jgi:phosphatidylinositol alpha-1,6-mannosyltransferase
VTAGPILALVTEAFGGRGGIAQYNRDLIQALLPRAGGAPVEILPRLAPDAAALPAGARQQRPVMSRWRYALRAFWTGLRRRPGVVLCGHLYMAPLARLVARLTGAPLVVQLHGVEIWNAPSAGHRRALEAAALVLCVSRDTRSRVISWCDVAPERVVVLPNTVGEAYAPADRSAARAAFDLADQPMILSVGRLDARERYKGHDRVIGLLAGLIPQRPGLVYVVAGDGDDRGRLERLGREAGVEANIRFLGQVPASALPDLYRAADVFVLPSTGEGFGIVYLEAMACGTPAVGLAVAGVVDALGDGDLGTAVTPERLGEAIASALASPLSEPDRHDLAQRTRDRFGRAAFESHARALLARVA